MSRPAPIPNSYWLPGSRIVAGEYPRDEDPGDARQKLGTLLDAGITSFVDLTEEADAEPYEPLLRDVARERAVAVQYVRLPIPDFGVPRSPREMTRILDAIDAAHRAGHTVYVHCIGGSGRTGTVVGCHLVRGGLAGDEALARVGELWRTVKKAHRLPRSPETDEQRRYVREWPKHDTSRRQHAAGVATGRYFREQVRGALVGLAVGDAVGTAVEFRRPGSFPPVTDMAGGGVFGLEAGQWTDDTAMALCLAESLVETGGFDARDQLARYVRWYRRGHLSSTGGCFDIGNTTRAALERFERTGDPRAGSTDANTAGNGSIMRLAPVAMCFARRAAEGVEACGESSRTTHGAPVAVDACRYLGALMLGAFGGASKQALLSPHFTPVAGHWDAQPLHPAIAEVAGGSFLRKRPPQIRGTGYAAESLEAALWAFATTRSFRDGCLAAVNLGDDADTTAAVYGQIAGAFYGEEGIPHEWRRRLARWETIDRLAEGLYEGGGRPFPPNAG